MTYLREALAKIRDEEARRAEATKWRPEPGEVIEGTITDIYQTRHSVAVSIDEGDQERTVYTGPVRLKSRLAEADVQVGDRVAIEYEGEVDTGGAHPSKRYLVAVEPGERTGKAFDWTPYLPPWLQKDGGGDDGPIGGDPWASSRPDEEPPF